MISYMETTIYPVTNGRDADYNPSLTHPIITSDRIKDLDFIDSQPQLLPSIPYRTKKTAVHTGPLLAANKNAKRRNKS